MPLDFTLLYFFIPVFFVISITPGLCMTLALTMGITIGVRNTMKMMVGELIGVLVVAGTAVIGGGAIIATFPREQHYWEQNIFEGNGLRVHHAL